MNALMIWDNPLVIRGIRTRLRLPYLLSWSLITVVAFTFLYMFFAGNLPKIGLQMGVDTQTRNLTPQEAAREAILPLLVLQGMILMVMGTGSVAGGVARERTYRLLDYQRLTPMSPAAKIIGMLVGLPIREYFMFAISLPFVFYAAWRGGMAFGVLIQFYIVFISSTVLYHMTGLVAGMVVDQPWRAGTVSQGLVVVLYLMLPQVSNIGFTFFEFLTARPVFYGLVQQHLMPDGFSGMGTVAFSVRRYDSVSFFGMVLSPTFFSLAVQGYAMLSLYVIVHRKWQGESRLAFSKGFGVLFFAVAQLFLVGSVQPYLRDDAMFQSLAKNYVQHDPVHNPMQVIVFAIFLLTLTVSGCMAILTLYLCTPSFHQSIAGLRRTLRRGGRGLAWSDDAASSLPVAVACMLMSWLSFMAIHETAQSAGRLSVNNPSYEFILPLLFFAVVLVTVQQVVEQFSERVFVMFMFLFWLVPVLVAVIVATNLSRPVSAIYIAMLFPFIALWCASALLNSDAQVAMSTDVLPSIYTDHAGPVLILSLVFYTSVALLLLLRARWRWQRISRVAGEGPASEAPPAEPSDADVPRHAQPEPVYATRQAER